MGRNLDNESRKFLMYPRFIQVFLDKQLEGLSNHVRKYVAPSHTKKIFRNMRRVGKGSSENITPLFPTMVTQKTRKAKRKDTQVPQLSGPTESVADVAVYKELDDSLVRAATTASSLKAEQDSGGVKQLEKKQRSRTHKIKRLYKVGLSARIESFDDNEDLGEDASKQERKIYDIDADEDITIVNDQDDEQMFDVNNLQGEEVFVQEDVADKEV
nr:hypothetical protein [Tanacetum cinerariifolium]